MGELLDRNPTSISVSNLLPDYYIFQPLDSTSIPIETNNRMQITLTWDMVTGDDLAQLMDIIGTTQNTTTRRSTSLTFDDTHILSGDVLLISANVSPHPGTGGYYGDIFVPLVANVTMTVMPYNFLFWNGT